MTPIVLVNFRPLLCLVRRGGSGLRRGAAQGVPVRIGERVYALDPSLLERADAFSTDRLYQAGLVVLANLPADQERLSASGFTVAWAADLRHDLEVMHALDLQRRQAAMTTQVQGALGETAEQEAEALARRLLLLIRSAGVHSFFVHRVSDLRSRKGRLAALVEVATKARVPALRQVLLDIGVGEGDLRRAEELSALLHRGRGQQLTALAEQRTEAQVLRAAKAIILGDIMRLSSVARAELPAGRWQAYQMLRLLNLPRRRPPAPPPPAATPTEGAAGPGPAETAAAPAAEPTAPPAPVALPARHAAARRRRRPR
ncbi:MAG: hypothetical protein RMK29_13520 [Myxococcales bacterium]|nr:hypothetical protein [Myxococcota bacterium]MDW8282727.1 hypothetical protein [Myxococcales bacterium]